MAEESNQPGPEKLPAFVRRLTADDTPETIAKALPRPHPDYAVQADAWRILLDEFESAGGFLSGEYLWRFPNEQGQDFERRQTYARHHGYLEALVDVYVRHIFSQAPRRTTTDEGLRAFWADVNGASSDMDEFMREAVALSLVCGHTGILVDMSREEPTGPSRSDQKGRPRLIHFPAPAIVDWRLVQNQLRAVKLRECAPESDLVADPLQGADRAQWLLWDTEGWARFNAKGELLGGGMPGLGVVPLVVLRPKPSILRPFFGRPLIPSAKVLQALYNRMSEEDQVIRDQAASLLTVEVGPDGDVEAARKQLGQEYGTTRAVVIQGKVKFEAPSMTVPATVAEHVRQLTREVYRMAHMRYERDSMQAESAEAIRLQFAELNEVLQGVAAAAADAERQIARLYFAWTEATPEAAEAAFRNAAVTIEYADEFFLDDPVNDLEAWSRAVALQLGNTMTQRIKKRAARRIEPEMPIEILSEVDREIEAMPSDGSTAVLSAAERLRVNAKRRLESLTS